MATPRKVIGEIPCHCCGERVPLREQTNGLVLVKCDWCGVMVQATDKAADEKIRGRARINSPMPEPAKPAAPAAPSPTPNTPPAQARKTAGTLLG